MATTTHSSPLSLKRTIHPVGQGAFYSEQFFNKEIETPLFTAVYDCGGQIANLKIEIDKISDVDILFISHFHDDHIKGLPFLIPKKNPKKIVFPKISPCLFLVDFVWNVIHDLKSMSGAKLMLKFLPILSNGDGQTIDGMVYIPVMGKRAFSILLHSEKWEYISFYDENVNDSTDSTVFSKLISILNLPADLDKSYQLKDFYEDIASALKKNPETVKVIKKDIYEVNYPLGHNSYSMPVLSHKCDDKSCEMNCLYTGDIKADASTINIVSEYTPNFLQMPHHGSYENHDVRMYAHHPIAFASVGTKNKFHHPGILVLNDICKLCSEVHFVTEHTCSCFSREELI